MTDPGLVAALVAFAPGLIATARGHLSWRAIWLINLVGLACVVSIIAWLPGVAFLLIGLIWSLGGNTRDNQRRHAALVAKAMSAALAERDRT